ncbi:bifunctional oligoribonuclease/PAP phosphatase NrnA [Candidatus Parcubacteria bacterium]|nr:bifunctional oligoribonuclease/PAP phosphatase NrnA [Candidatus Parcubacteria bacterium]
MLKERYKEAYNQIQKAKNILLVTHNRPDGDALASTGAVAEYLTNIKKNWSAFCLDKPPYQFNFLAHVEKIIYDRNEINFNTFDLIIALDCGSLSRTNLVEEIKNRTEKQIFIEFDHHPKIDDYSNIEIRNPQSSSAAEVLYHFFKINKIKINKEIANCILTGILTDTGNFLFPSTTDQTIKIASEMMIDGAKFPMIIENTWRNKSVDAMKIWGTAINNLKINQKYNFAYSILTKDDIKNQKVTEEELEGIPEFLSNLYGVAGLVLLREQKDGKIKGSLRTSHPDIDVSKIAKNLGGGGHKKASGFTIKGKLKKLKTGWEVI